MKIQNNKGVKGFKGFIDILRVHDQQAQRILDLMIGDAAWHLS